MVMTINILTAGAVGSIVTIGPRWRPLALSFTSAIIMWNIPKSATYTALKYRNAQKIFDECKSCQN